MSATNNARLVAELQAVTLGINLVGLDRLPEVMRDGAAPAQTQDLATMTDTNTVHGGAVEAERYVDGRLDLTHAPSLGTFIGKTLASFVSRNNMPEISGDNRKRIPEHERRRYDPACVRLAEEILAALHPAPQTDTDAREKVVEALDEDEEWSESPLANALYDHVQSQFCLHPDEAAEETGAILQILKDAGPDAILAALSRQHQEGEGRE